MRGVKMKQELYGKKSLILRLADKLRIKRGFVVVGCSVGMAKELAEVSKLNN